MYSLRLTCSFFLSGLSFEAPTSGSIIINATRKLLNVFLIITMTGLLFGCVFHKRFCIYCQIFLSSRKCEALSGIQEFWIPAFARMTDLLLLRARENVNLFQKCHD